MSSKAALSIELFSVVQSLSLQRKDPGSGAWNIC